MNIKVAIGLPTNRGVKAKTVESLLNLKGYSEVIVSTEGYTIAENRLYIVQKARQRECTHLLFIDDDMIFPENTLEQLLSHKKDVIGVVSNARVINESTTVVREDGETLLRKDIQKELFKCEHVGTGIMLINLDIIKDLTEPYFGFATYPNGVTLRGEDAWFCKKVRESGHEVWCDPTLEIKHIGDYQY